MGETIMLVEDDLSTRRVLDLILTNEGFSVVSFANGKEALKALERVCPNLLLVDIMMPDLDGIEFSRTIRQRSELNNIPIVVLTAKKEKIDRYEAFHAGVTDFIEKPYDAVELIFRIKSLLRVTAFEKSETKDKDEVEVSTEFTLDPARFLATVHGREISLTKMETALLVFFVANKGQVFSAEKLASEINATSHHSASPSGDAIHAHVRNLRAKLEDNPKAPRFIVTVGRKGYSFQP